MFLDISIFFVCFLFLSNILIEFILNIKNSIRPEIVYRIPDINKGGMESIEIFIARYVEAIIIHVNTKINHILFVLKQVKPRTSNILNIKNLMSKFFGAEKLLPIYKIFIIILKKS